MEMEFRKPLSLQVQDQILDDIKKNEPFRVWLGVSWQAKYMIRPRELRDVTEECVDRERGLIILLRPKGRKPFAWSHKTWKSFALCRCQKKGTHHFSVMKAASLEPRLERSSAKINSAGPGHELADV